MCVCWDGRTEERTLEKRRIRAGEEGKGRVKGSNGVSPKGEGYNPSVTFPPTYSHVQSMHLYTHTTGLM